MSARAWAYIGGILALGALLSGLTLPGWAAVIAQWPTFAALTVLATLAQLYKAEAPNHQTYFATPVFLFAGLLLLHPRDGTAGSDGAGKPGLARRGGTQTSWSQPHRDVENGRQWSN